MQKQHTLSQPVSLVGVGLHSGQPVSVTLRPAKAFHGIRFVRTDLQDAPSIPAHYKQVINTQMATTIGIGRVSVSTVEHLMCALHGLGIDNATVEVNGPELPIMDGSSDPFYQLLLASGVQEQDELRPLVLLKRKVEIHVEDKWAIAEPAPHLKVRASIEWSHPSIGVQHFTYEQGRTNFSEISRARTFGFLKDVEAMKRMGLARGGSLDNAVVLNHEKVLNPGGLRFKDEFARHKVLDALGDLTLSGAPLVASFDLHKAGHDLHWQLLTVIFKNPENYEILDASIREERRISRIRAALASGFVASI